VPAELRGPLAQAEVGAVELRAGVGDADPGRDLVQVAVVLGPVEALESELARPLLAHPRERAQAVLPVDQRAAPERGAGLERDLALHGGERAAAQVEVLV